MKLYPYQDIGARFLAERKYALLADTMGIGKTAQAVRAVDLVGARRVLVLGPAAVREGWLREFHRWSPMSHKAVALVAGAAPLAGHEVTICSYDMAAMKPVRSRLMAQRYDVLILDESHKVKDRAAKRTQFIYGEACNRSGGLAERAERVWCLSGTPMPNAPTELWVMLRAFGICQQDYWSFTRTFCEGRNTPYGFKVTGIKNVPALKRLMDPVTLRRRLTDVELELPPISYLDYRVEPADPPLEFFTGEGWWADPKQAKRDLDQQAEMVRAILRTTRGEDRLRALAAVSIATATMRRYIGLAKVEPAVDMVQRLLKEDPKEKVVVFAQHRDVLKMLKMLLVDARPVIYWGGLSHRTRGRYLNRFKSSPRCRVLLAQIEAAGTGLDGLQHIASTVVVVEQSWSPHQNAQAVMRIHRNGQKRPVRAFFVSAAETIDEHISRVLRRKTEMIISILD